ncbi:hypothetical protein RB598_007047 [Gaeumannomyces tritici]
MSAAIAMAPSPAPHDRPSFPSDVSPSAQRTALPPPHAQRVGSGSPRGVHPASASAPAPTAQALTATPSSNLAPALKSSPPSASRNGSTPKIIVKKEPGSPEHAPRRRPGRLDLSKGGGSNTAAPGTGRPLTARDGLGIQEVGLACLSPGFVTQDPVMKEQLQRSMSVREQQRHIIEARLQQQSAKGDGPDQGRDKDVLGQFAAKTPGMSRRNKAPPGLSIVAPSHEHFAHERVIQSAPLGQTFTGMHSHHPPTRHITNQPSKLSNTSHIHHVPAHQTNNRLPPISDVFGQGLSGHPDSGGHALFAKQSASRGPLASPGHPSSQQHPQPPLSSRPREYKSAEEAQVELAGGRPELLPKIVHYGGHQPPTPPSPQPGHQRASDPSRSASRRRTRAEYEEGASPPLGTGRPPRRGPFGEGRDSPETQRAKRDEFLRICERAWDLFHS